MLGDESPGLLFIGQPGIQRHERRRRVDGDGRARPQVIVEIQPALLVPQAGVKAGVGAPEPGV